MAIPLGIVYFPTLHVVRQTLVDALKKKKTIKKFYLICIAETNVHSKFRLFRFPKLRFFNFVKLVQFFSVLTKKIDVYET